MMVRSSVLLPTPLRPRTATLPFCATANETPSSTMASPYPERMSRSSSIFPEIHLTHARIAADLVGRAFDQDAPADHHDDAAGEAEHHVHVVLDEEHGELVREIRDHGEELGAFALWHARGRLIQQQHARAGGERERDLEQALLPVGELARFPIWGNIEGTENRGGFVDRRPEARELPPPVVRVAFALEHRDGHRLERGELRKQGVDLKGSREALAHPSLRF